MDITISPEAAGVIAGVAIIAAGLTKKVMDWTGDWFDTTRFAQPISLLCCILASLIWEAIHPGGGWLWIGVRGLLAWSGSSTLHGSVKTAKAHVARKKVDDSGE